MDRIEFNKYPDFWTMLNAALVGCWLYRRTAAWLALTLLLFFVLATIPDEAPQYAYLIIPVIAFVLGMWVSSLVRFCIGLSRRWKAISQAQNDPGHVNYLDESGLGFQSNTSSGFFAWKEIMSFYETRKFFFVKYRDSDALVICKQLFSDDVISSIRRILDAAPVKDKHLRLRPEGSGGDSR